MGCLDELKYNMDKAEGAFFKAGDRAIPSLGKGR